MSTCRLGSAAALITAACCVAGCLSDEGPLFSPVGARSSQAAGAPLEAAPGALQPAPTAQAVSASEQPPVPRLELPAAPRAAAPEAAAPPSEASGEVPASGEEEVPPEGVAPCELDGVLSCDAFEDQVVGEFPAGGAWLPELEGCGTHTVDGAGPAFSGAKALRADEGAYPECMLHADVSGLADVYVQSRVYLGGGADLVSSYVSLIELGASATKDDPELRVGLRPATDAVCDGSAGVDLTGSGLVGGTRTACSGVALEQERWYCVGVHVSREGPSSSVSVSIDGGEVLAEVLALSGAWGESSLFVKLGRAAYGAAGPGSLWHDDVVISSAPIPCD